ncbi:response regulator transcription factor [Marinoscillum furvescens]|uniref:Response regulator receiver domain-containing protein n=1 Tax=Marinoscillum furvescens DSM 4134 TaxID=1122208 RepID=A0A3D9KZG6_MARFU|nr:helix-turn-helix domain-containing protein [Marinoscillum furvescens]RED95306.1 response regulator receiver domain-containing protein [Marinoscillum furvescens DSM 4134]
MKHMPEKKLNKRLLLAVSDDSLALSLVDLFDEEYELICVSNGQEAMERLKTEAVSLIIASVSVPLMDGYMLCKALKANLFTAHVPVVLLTTRNTVQSGLDCLEAGADDYICWPSDERLLQLKIRNMVHSRRWVAELMNPGPEEGGMLHYSNEVLIKRATNDVEENLSNCGYTASDLGRALGLSRMQLYRKLKSATGQSANEFIRSIRMRRAALLLYQQQLTIAEITYKVGFSDLSYFRKCFKATFGVNPSEYVQRESSVFEEEIIAMRA